MICRCLKMVGRENDYKTLDGMEYSIYYPVFRQTHLQIAFMSMAYYALRQSWGRSSDHESVHPTAGTYCCVPTSRKSQHMFLFNLLVMFKTYPKHKPNISPTWPKCRISQPSQRPYPHLHLHTSVRCQLHQAFGRRPTDGGVHRHILQYGQGSLRIGVRMV